MVMRVISKKCLHKVMHWLCTEIGRRENKDFLLATSPLGCQLTSCTCFQTDDFVAGFGRQTNWASMGRFDPKHSCSTLLLPAHLVRYTLPYHSKNTIILTYGKWESFERNPLLPLSPLC